MNSKFVRIKQPTYFVVDNQNSIRFYGLLCKQDSSRVAPVAFTCYSHLTFFYVVFVYFLVHNVTNAWEWFFICTHAPSEPFRVWQVGVSCSMSLFTPNTKRVYSVRERANIRRTNYLSARVAETVTVCSQIASKSALNDSPEAVSFHFDWSSWCSL